MTGEPAVKRAPALLRLHLSDQLVHAFPDGDPATVQSAVALMRTLFEDHHVDPEHQSCLFFNGRMLAGKRTDDFAVLHRGDNVVLSEFTFPVHGAGTIILPIAKYAMAVVRFAARVLVGAAHVRHQPHWVELYVNTQRQYLRELLRLGKKLILGRYENYAEVVQEFQAGHGQLRQPLQLDVLAVPEAGDPWKPSRVVGWVNFGPVARGEQLPMRLNGGDVVLVTVEGFGAQGVRLRVEGVGSGGIRAGDCLRGLQLFYP